MNYTMSPAQARSKVKKLGFSIVREPVSREWVVQDTSKNTYFGMEFETAHAAADHCLISAITVIELNFYLATVAKECPGMSKTKAEDFRDWLLEKKAKTPSALAILNSRHPSPSDLEESHASLVERHGLPISMNMLASIKKHYAAIVHQGLREREKRKGAH